MKKLLTLICILVGITTVGANAQKASKGELPGKPALVSSEEELKKLAAKDTGNFKYNVEDYFTNPKATQFKISPDGKYISYREKDDKNKNHVYVKEIKSGKVARVLNEGDELIRRYYWATNSRIIYNMDKGGNENYHVYAVNIDGSGNEDLTPFEGVKVSILDMLKEDKNNIIISMNKNNRQLFEPYKLNIVTGELVKLFENNDPSQSIQDWYFDKNGNLRAYTKAVNGLDTQLLYKDLKTGKFNTVKNMKWYERFYILEFKYSGKIHDQAYVLTNLDSDKLRVVLYDFKADKVIKEIFANEDYDIQGASFSRKRNYEIDYFSYEGDKSVTVPVSSFYKDFHSCISKAFPDKEFSITSTDDNENNLIFTVTSDRFYGAIYQYEVKTKKIVLLYDLMPQLKEDDMAPMHPIKFKSRDGLTIHGYITLPKAAIEGEKVPLIVNPHGGPHGVRDSWEFNPEAQLFASRGYATLHVNFRISGGYGKNFLKIGFKQIGRKCMDDVEDGIYYALSQGWTDKNKIAIYGGSHGGYATLMGLIRTPDLYACGVDYVGVSSIFTFMNTMPEYWKPLTPMIKEAWYDIDIEEEAKIAREVSPAYHTDKIKKPLFVAQGANDPRVNIDESDQIVEALRKRGIEVPYMVKYNEGHGFHHEENKIEFYRCMLGFFAEHLR